VRGRTDYPLAFDREYRAKPFVHEIIKMAKRYKKGAFRKAQKNK